MSVNSIIDQHEVRSSKGNSSRILYCTLNISNLHSSFYLFIFKSIFAPIIYFCFIINLLYII